MLTNKDFLKLVMIENPYWINGLYDGFLYVIQAPETTGSTNITKRILYNTHHEYKGQ